MEKSEYKNIYLQENQHFFYIANHQLILHLIRTNTPSQHNLKILDAGCGTGLLTKKMSIFGQVTGLDISSEAIKFAKKRGIKIVKGSVDQLPFRSNTFDLVTCIDVIYHREVNNDLQSLKEFRRVLKPGGLLIMRVPAHNWLIRSIDLHIHTKRRYNMKDLKQKLVKSNFKIKKISYINMLLFPPAVLSFFLEKISDPKISSSPLIKLPSFINSFIAKILLSETLLIDRIDLPFGLGIVSVSKK